MLERAPVEKPQLLSIIKEGVFPPGGVGEAFTDVSTGGSRPRSEHTPAWCGEMPHYLQGPGKDTELQKSSGWDAFLFCWLCSGWYLDPSGTAAEGAPLRLSSGRLPALVCLVSSLASNAQTHSRVVADARKWWWWVLLCSLETPKCTDACPCKQLA